MPLRSAWAPKLCWCGGSTSVWYSHRWNTLTTCTCTTTWYLSFPRENRSRTGSAAPTWRTCWQFSLCWATALLSHSAVFSPRSCTTDPITRHAPLAFLGLFLHSKYSPPTTGSVGSIVAFLGSASQQSMQYGSNCCSSKSWFPTHLSSVTWQVFWRAFYSLRDHWKQPWICHVLWRPSW